MSKRVTIAAGIVVFGALAWVAAREDATSGVESQPPRETAEEAVKPHHESSESQQPAAVAGKPAARSAPEPAFHTSGFHAHALGDRAPGVSYAPLEAQQLPEEVKASLRESARRLKETGSLSGGKPTHEFAHMDHFAKQLREKGWANLMRELAITPTDFSALLGPTYLLVGADVQGKDVASLGRAGFYQVFQSPTQAAELSEEQFDVLTGDGTVIGTEMINAAVGPHPATLETLNDANGLPLVNVQWVVNNRSLFLTTRNLQRDEALALASGISRRIESMPHGGWRVPYEYDDDNPLHRITRARLAGSTQPPR